MSGISIYLKGYALWAVLPLALALGYFIARLYRRETEGLLNAGARLRLLRACAVILMVLLLVQPVVHSISLEREKPVVIVLRDITTSMTVKDTHEPVERRVRAAVALGLLDGKLRDTNAEAAGKAFALAQTAADSAAAGARQAAQSLQESASNAAGARERVSRACEALSTAQKELERGAKSLHALNPPPPLAAVAEQQAQAAAKVREQLSTVTLEKADGQARVAECAKAVAALTPELEKLVTEATRAQDAADAALGQNTNPAVKTALDKLATMDRAAIVAGMLDGKAIHDISGVRLVQYGIDTDLRELSSDAKPSGATDTDLATPLIHIAERHAQESIAAVVVCSDGRHTSGPVPEDAARLLAARGIAVHTLGAGSESAPPDICVARLDGSQSVFMEETIRLTAHIKVSGFKGQKCVLALTRDEKPVKDRELTFGEDGWLHENFEIPADKAGPNVFTATIKPLPGEALTSNNSAEFIVDVASDRLKVLLADEMPRWESRYVAALLRRERKMTLDERWLLSGEGLGPKPLALPKAEKGEKAETALDEYEIIVIGDVPADRLGEADQKRLAAYVADRGGFLVLLAGPKSMPQSYLSGPIADLLPVKQQAPASMLPALASAAAAERARVKLDTPGLTHEITRILRDPALNEKLWTDLPELHWVARPAYAKPLATTLLVTDDARKDVVVAIQNYGAGRVMYVGTDGTWNWRYKVADRVHAFFWSQAMRWGTSNRLIGGARLKVGCTRRQIRPGENIEILARPRDAEGRNVGDAAVFADLGDPEHPQRVQLQAVPDSGGLYRGYMQNIGAGVHNISIKVDSAGFEGIQESIQVIARDVAGQEGIELSRDSARLAAMAKAGNGRYLDILDAPELFAQLAGQGKERIHESNYEVWSSYPILLLIVGLLAAEWIMRKRLGLS